MTSLAQELVDTIIDYLHDDSKALHACALTCQSWLPSSRHHIFRVVELETHQQCIKFWSLVKSNLGLGALVQIISIRERGHLWVEEDLPLVAPYISEARTMSVCDVTFTARVQACICMHFASVKRLELNLSRFPAFPPAAGLLQSFPKLTELDLWGIFWGSDVDGSSHDNGIRPKLALHNLFIGYCHVGPLINWLSSTSSLERIKTLSLRLGAPLDILPLATLLRSAGPSLEDLTVNCGLDIHGGFATDGRTATSVMSANKCSLVSTDPLFYNIDLAANPSLRSLTVQRVEAVNLGWLLSFMLSLPEIARIEDLTFEVDAGGFDPACVSTWRNIGDLLTRSMFESLRTVGFEIGCKSSKVAGWEDTIKQAMPALFSRGIVTIS